MDIKGTPKDLRDAVGQALEMFSNNPNRTLVDYLEQTLSELICNRAGVISLGDNLTRVSVACELIKLIGAKKVSK